MAQAKPPGVHTGLGPRVLPGRAAGQGLWHAACGSQPRPQHAQSSMGPEATLASLGATAGHTSEMMAEPQPGWGAIICSPEGLGRASVLNEREEAFWTEAGGDLVVVWEATTPLPKAGRVGGRGCRPHPASVSQMSNSPTHPGTAR